MKAVSTELDKPQTNLERRQRDFESEAYPNAPEEFVQILLSCRRVIRLFIESGYGRGRIQLNCGIPQRQKGLRVVTEAE